MKSLERWFDRKEEELRDEVGSRPSLYTLTFRGSISLYPFYRLTWPLMGTLYRAGIGYFVWNAISEDLPLFSWTEFFIWIQTIYVLEFIVSAILESVRSDLRENARPVSHFFSRREKKYFAIAHPIAFLPFLYFSVRLGWDLHYAGRPFGFYDAMTGIILLRFWIMTILRFETGLHAFRSRVRLFAWNWIVPSLVFGIFYFSCRGLYGPWAVIIALTGEFIAQVGLQLWRRIRVDPEMTFARLMGRLKVMTLGIQLSDLKRGGEILRSVLSRLSLFPIFSWVHFYLIYLFAMQKIDLEESVLLHALSPIFSFISRAAIPYWKELYETRARDCLSEAYRKQLMKLVGMLSALIIGAAGTAGALDWIPPTLSLILYWAALVGLSVFCVLDVWLGIKPIGWSDFIPHSVLFLLALFVYPYSPELLLVAALFLVAGTLIAGSFILRNTPSRGYTHFARLRRRFWIREVMDPALLELRELGIESEPGNHGLLVRIPSRAEEESFLMWGRGWILDWMRLSEFKIEVRNGPSDAQTHLFEFNVTSLRWISGKRPVLEPTDQGSLFQRIHSGLSRGLTHGKIRLDSARIRWELQGSILKLYARRAD